MLTRNFLKNCGETHQMLGRPCSLRQSPQCRRHDETKENTCPVPVALCHIAEPAATCLPPPQDSRNTEHITCLLGFPQDSEASICTEWQLWNKKQQILTRPQNNTVANLTPLQHSRQQSKTMFRFFCLFGCKKINADGMPSSRNTNSPVAAKSCAISCSSDSAKPPPIEISPSHVKNDNVAARDSLDSASTDNSELNRPPCIEKPCQSAFGMEAICKTVTQNDTKPQSRNKRSSKLLTITASRTKTKTWEWHNLEGFTSTEKNPCKPAFRQTASSHRPAEKPLNNDPIEPQHGCNAPSHKCDNTVHFKACGLECDARQSPHLCQNPMAEKAIATKSR